MSIAVMANLRPRLSWLSLWSRIWLTSLGLATATSACSVPGPHTDGSSTADSEDESDENDDEGAHNNENQPLTVNGKLSVKDGQLTNEHGHPIQLRGMSSHGLQWHAHCLTDRSLDILAYDWGADLLRTSMYIQEGGYETKPDYFRKLVNRLIQSCEDRGIYCMVDWHQLHPGDPNENLELAKEFFERMAKEHVGRKNVIYEICNEPNGRGVDWPTIKKYADEVIPLIRKHDPDAVIVVGTPRWASNPHLVLGDELDYENILYTMHFYANGHGQQFRDYVEQALDGGIGIFVTEFGTQEASGDGPNDFEESQKWIDFMAKHKISWANWNFSDNERSGAAFEDGSCGLAKFDDDRLKPSGKWIKERLSDPPDDFPTD